MYIYKDAVVLMPTKEEHDKFASFIEAYSDITWANGCLLSGRAFAGVDRAYSITDGSCLWSRSGYYAEHKNDEYKAAVDNNLFLVSVDEYIARCLGWNDAASEIDFDVTDLL